MQYNAITMLSYNQDMNIAILTDLPFWYTDTMYLKELENRLRLKGVNTKVFVIGNNGIFHKIDPVTGIMRFFNTIKIIKHLSSFDLVHVQFTFPVCTSLAIMSKLGLMKKPIIVHTHGYDVFTVPKIGYGLRRDKFGKMITHFTWGQVNKIIAACERAKDEIRKSGIDANKIDVLYNGIDEISFGKNKILPELQSLRNETDFVILSVASLSPVKNHLMLIKSFQNIIKKYSSKYRVKLLLIGEKINSFNLSIEDPNIIYLGKKNHSELKNFYSIADVFVLPSLSEAHPWSLLEAMSCELPVIASNVGGIPETISDPRFLIDPHDLNDLVIKIGNIIEMNKEERLLVGKMNRERVLKYYTLDKHVENLKRLYDKAIFNVPEKKINPNTIN